MKTYMLKNEQKQNNWLLIDAAGQVLGRLASQIAIFLRGKHKPNYTPNVMCGDRVVVINTNKTVLTGKKYNNKLYYRYTGYMGGLRTTVYKDVIKKHPDLPLRKAVERMLSSGPLRNRMMHNLYIYTNNEHKHSAQNPQLVRI